MNNEGFEQRLLDLEAKVEAIIKVYSQNASLSLQGQGEHEIREHINRIAKDLKDVKS